MPGIGHSAPGWVKRLGDPVGDPGPGLTSIRIWLMSRVLEFRSAPRWLNFRSCRSKPFFWASLTSSQNAWCDVESRRSSLASVFNTGASESCQSLACGSSNCSGIPDIRRQFNADAALPDRSPGTCCDENRRSGNSGRPVSDPVPSSDHLKVFNPTNSPSCSSGPRSRPFCQRSSSLT